MFSLSNQAFRALQRGTRRLTVVNSTNNPPGTSAWPFSTKTPDLQVPKAEANNVQREMDDCGRANKLVWREIERWREARESLEQARRELKLWRQDPHGDTSDKWSEPRKELDRISALRGNDKITSVFDKVRPAGSQKSLA